MKKSAEDRIFLTQLNALKMSLGAACAGIKFHVRTLDLSTALSDADGSQAVSIQANDAGVNFPANARLLGAGTVVKQAVAGTSLSALTVTIGDAAAATELMTATDLFGDAVNSFSQAPGAHTFGQLEAAGYVPLATYASTGANVADVTGIVVHVIAYWLLENPFVDGVPAGLVLAA